MRLHGADSICGHDKLPPVIVAFALGVDDAVELMVEAEVTGDRLVVGVGSYTLTCQRRGAQADVPALEGTGG